MDAKILGEIEKNLQSSIRVTDGEFKGERRIDIRVYYVPGADPSELLPTKKGVNLTMKQVDELRQILSAIK